MQDSIFKKPQSRADPNPNTNTREGSQSGVNPNTSFGVLLPAKSCPGSHGKRLHRRRFKYKYDTNTSTQTQKVGAYTPDSTRQIHKNVVFTMNVWTNGLCGFTLMLYNTKIQKYTMINTQIQMKVHPKESRRRSASLLRRRCHFNMVEMLNADVTT